MTTRRCCARSQPKQLVLYMEHKGLLVDRAAFLPALTRVAVRKVDGYDCSVTPSHHKGDVHGLAIAKGSETN